MKFKDREALTTAPDGRPMEEQPKWRRDFPIDWEQDELVSRRDLVKFLTLTSAAFVCGHAWIATKVATNRSTSTAMARSQITRVEDVAVGGALVFHYPEGSPPRILVRLREDHFVAYDQQCTHLLCPVVPQPEQDRFHCPCHNGVFDIETGRPLSGPPRRALPRVTLEVADGVVWAVDIAPEAT